MSLVQPSDYLIYPIDWSSEPKLRRTWYSNILLGMKGNEQRSMLRTLIRHCLVVTICSREEQMTNELKRKILKNLHNVWGVPVWPYEMKLTSSVGIGATSLNVQSTVGREVVSFGKVLIGNYLSYDIVTPTSVTSTSISLSGELPTKAWASGKKLYPLLRADLGDVQEFSQPTPFHYKAEYTFIESFIDVETPL
jgi:hypothetical protein